MPSNKTCPDNVNGYPNLTNFYIGLSLALLSCFFMGFSYIVKKLSLNRLISLGKRAGDGGYGYLKDWMWWLGLILMGVGEIINSVAYGFAPASLITPLGSLSVLFTTILSSKILNEHLNFLGKIGCLVCLCGSTIIVLHAPKEQIVNSVVELTNRVISTGFIIFVGIVVLMNLILLLFCAPRYGKINPLIFVLVSSSIGSLSVMSVKGIGVCIQDLIGKKQIWKYWIFYVVIISLILGLIIQVNYLNKALDLFNTNIVTPLIYVCFTTFVIIASSILLEEWISLTFVDCFGIIIGFILIILGFFLLYFFKELDITWHKLKSNFINNMYRDYTVLTSQNSLERNELSALNQITVNEHVEIDDDFVPFLGKPDVKNC